MSQSLQLLVPLGLAMTQSFPLVVPLGLTMTRSFQLLVPLVTRDDSVISAFSTLGTRK